MSLETVLDLHELATIFLYEALSTEPRFRHAKLIEVEPNAAFQTIFMDVWSPEWHKLGYNKNNRSASIGYAMEKRQYGKFEERDTPENMVESRALPSGKVLNLSDDEKELIFHQTRLHYGISRLNQMFERVLDLLPSGTQLRIRTIGKLERVVRPQDSQISGYYVEKPVQPSLTIVNSHPAGAATTYANRVKAYTSGDKLQVPHGVLIWPPLLKGEEGVCLDMNAMSFGEIGRSRDKCLFILDTQSEHEALVRRCGDSLGMDHAGTTWQDLSGDSRYTSCAEDAVPRVLKRCTSTVAVPFCGYCGAPQMPDKLKNCPCKDVYYCSPAHQAKHWKYHKVWCTTKREKKAV